MPGPTAAARRGGVAGSPTGKHDSRRTHADAAREPRIDLRVALAPHVEDVGDADRVVGRDRVDELELAAGRARRRGPSRWSRPCRSAATARAWSRRASPRDLRARPGTATAAASRRRARRPRSSDELSAPITSRRVADARIELEIERDRADAGAIGRSPPHSSGHVTSPADDRRHAGGVVLHAGRRSCRSRRRRPRRGGSSDTRCRPARSASPGTRSPIATSDGSATIAAGLARIGTPAAFLTARRSTLIAGSASGVSMPTPSSALLMSSTDRSHEPAFA